jgi:RimJ/RimL family protein N-acetyltransferase
MKIETARLILTPIGAEHADELLVLHSDPTVAFWADALSPEQAAAAAVEWARQWRTNGVGKWIAHRRFDGALVGRGGLSLADVDGRRQLELGWILLTAARGQGFATEMGRAGLDYGFDVLGRDEIVSFTEVHNRASRAVMERLGMTFDKIIYSRGLIEGREGLHDNAPFALYRLAREETMRSSSAVQAR